MFYCGNCFFKFCSYEDVNIYNISIYSYFMYCICMYNFLDLVYFGNINK